MITNVLLKNNITLMNYRIFLLLTLISFGSLRAVEKPNVLWIVVDDMSANFSCYGEKAIITPEVDRLASEGMMFTRAYATSPVCSTFRSALITGMYQTTIGAHHHRSGRGKHRIQLPSGVRPIPKYFQEAGYWTCNGSGLAELDFRSNPSKRASAGKADYNFDWDKTIYDSNDWAGRRNGQPFFMQVQLHGGKLRGASVEANEALALRAKKELGSAIDPATIELPPHYPRDPVLLKDWSTYLDSVRITDRHVGRVIERLKKEGILETTLIVFFTDHGISHARGKQFLYDEGTHIPLILRGPGIPKDKSRKDLVEHIDIAALSLAAAGIRIPDTMQGRNILAKKYTQRETVFAARDRCGEAVDRIRSVRNEDYLYIRNFYPRRPLLQPSQYKDSKIIVKRLRELNLEGSLSDLSRRILFAPERPNEELYDYKNDPWQHNNLADNPKHASALLELRGQLGRWIEESKDPGSESPKVYAQEMADELSFIKRNSPRHETFRKNAAMYKQWASDGK